MPISGLWGMDIVILHWSLVFLSSHCVSLGALILIILNVAALALIPFDDWYALHGAAKCESSVEELEALYDLEDPRGVGHPRVPRLRGRQG